jgi:hypothetical protein
MFFHAHLLKRVKANASMHNKFTEQPNSLINSAYVHFIRAYRPIAFVIYVSLDVTAPSLNRDTWQKIPTFLKNNLNGQAWINKCVSLIRGGRHVTEASFLVPFTSTCRLMVQILDMLLFSFKKIVFPRRK